MNAEANIIPHREQDGVYVDVNGYGLYTKSAEGFYKKWDQRKCKLASAISGGTHFIRIRPHSKVMLVGVELAYTAGHVSCLVGIDGFVYAKEMSDDQAQVTKLDTVCSQRPNVRQLDPRSAYLGILEREVDVVYIDAGEDGFSWADIVPLITSVLRDGGSFILTMQARNRYVHEVSYRKVIDSLPTADGLCYEGSMELPHIPHTFHPHACLVGSYVKVSRNCRIIE